MGAAESYISAAMFPRPPPSYSTRSAPSWLRTARTPSGRAVAVAVFRPRRPRHPAAAVLYSHGNGEDLGLCAPVLASLADASGCIVVGYDYAGYGTSEGTPSEAAVKEDVVAAVGYLSDELGVPRSRTVLHGRSLGSGPTCFLAALAAKDGRPFAGVVLESPFCSAFRVVLPDSLIGWPVPGDRFANLELLKRKGGFGCPVWVVHGEADGVISAAHGRTLAAAIPPGQAPVPHLFVPGAGHNDVDLLLARTGRTLEAHEAGFLDACLDAATR